MTLPIESALLEARSVTKQFPGALALNHVDLALKRGEILALLGENGAGKSTLMKILAGVQPMDHGKIFMDSREIGLDSVRDALKHGIALIHQELNLASNLDVGANIFLGREPLRFGMIDRESIRTEARRLLGMVGLNISPNTIVGELTIGRQQMVEIAKALSINARVLIMDEPTSSLSQKETAQLFQVIKSLRAKGVSIIYISHRLGEVKELADRVAVLRDGANAGELVHDEIHHDAMVKLMIGRDLSQFYQRTAREPGVSLLEVKRLRTPAHPGCEVSFEVRAGEIVGLAGLVGAGRTEILQTLFGITPALEGAIHLKGLPTAIESPGQAIESGLALTPENRKEQGLIPGMSVRHNTSLASLCKDQRNGFLNHPREDQLSRDMITRIRIKTPSDGQLVQHLSGGNQQKVVLGKWLALKPSVLLLDEPTRGIDVGAKQEIYRLIEELSNEGMAILFVSSEMEEILRLADRVLVMHEGRITGELQRGELSEEAVMQLATGRQDSQPNLKL